MLQLPIETVSGYVSGLTAGHSSKDRLPDMKLVVVGMHYEAPGFLSGETRAMSRR